MAALAVTVAVPAAFAVTAPPAVTSTISGALLLQVTDLLVAFSGNIVAIRVYFCPTVRLSVVGSIVMDVGITASAFTVTVHSALFSPHFAVITAVPSFRAVTVPSAPTVATASSLLLHWMVFTVVSSGFTVAVSLPVPFTVSSMVV